MGGTEDARIYTDLMRFRPEQMSPNAWAVKAGVSRTVWTDMRRHGNPSRRTLEKLLIAAGSSLAEFEALRIGETGTAMPPAAGVVGEGRRRDWAPAPLAPLPVLQSSVGGEWGEGVELTDVRFDQRLDILPRPPSLAGDPDAFALTVVGDSMLPRFRPGRRVAVSPRSPVAIGDDVLVRLAGHGVSNGEPTLLKELVRRTGDHIGLRQYNPDKTFLLETDHVQAIYKVAGELI